MELPDGSERVRIKVEVAFKIRELSQELNLSFLETLYYVTNTYYAQKKKQTQTTTTQPPTVTPEISLALELSDTKNGSCDPIQADGGKTYEIDLGF